MNAFEPQKRQIELLRMNLEANGVRNASIYNRAVFCHNGTVTLDSLDRYERVTGINHGGVSIGLASETVSCVRVDDVDLRDIGFMHIDAQGAEPHILHSARKVLARDRPVVFFEDNRRHDPKLHDRVCEAEPDFIEESQFDAIDHCLNGLGYKTLIEQFNGGIDVLLAP